MPMRMKRLIQSLCMYFLPNDQLRTRFIRSQHIFDAYGERVYLQNKLIPLYAGLIRFHNNIVVGKKVEFVTHDAIHVVLNGCDPAHRAQEKIGCIEVMDNVFIGANSTILYGVRIGPNAIVAAGSLVNRDVSANSVVGGYLLMFLARLMTLRKNGEMVTQAILGNCARRSRLHRNSFAGICGMPLTGDRWWAKQ